MEMVRFDVTRDFKLILIKKIDTAATGLLGVQATGNLKQKYLLTNLVKIGRSQSRSHRRGGLFTGALPLRFLRHWKQYVLIESDGSIQPTILIF